MVAQDIFVGVVALCVGLFVTASAVMNTQAFGRFWLARRVGNAYGQGVARVAGGLVGLGFAALGVCLMFGLLPLKKNSTAEALDPVDITLPLPPLPGGVAMRL